MGLKGYFNLRMFLIRHARMLDGVLFGTSGSSKRQPAIAEKDKCHLPGHVKCRQKSSKQTQIKWPMGKAPCMSTVQNFILAPETGKEERHTAQGHHADSVSGKRYRHKFTQTTHAANILLLIQTMRSRRAKSPMRVVMNAFLAAAAALGL